MRVYRRQDGMVDNPLCNGKLQNEPCVCGSGRKTKKCCGVWFSLTPDVRAAVDRCLKYGIVAAQSDRDLIRKEREIAERKRSENQDIETSKRETEAWC